MVSHSGEANYQNKDENKVVHSFVHFCVSPFDRHYVQLDSVTSLFIEHCVGSLRVQWSKGSCAHWNAEETVCEKHSKIATTELLTSVVSHTGDMKIQN